jgi:hypothetical protein
LIDNNTNEDESRASNLTELGMLATLKKNVKVEESKLSIEDQEEESDSSSDQLSDMSSERVNRQKR